MIKEFGFLSDCNFLQYLNAIESSGEHELVLEKDENDGQTVLHKFFLKENEFSMQVFTKLIQIGGQQLIMSRDFKGCTALHIALILNVFHRPGEDKEGDLGFDIVSRMVDVGGYDLVMAKDDNGLSTFYYLCRNMKGPSTEIALKLIEIGGRELIIPVDHRGFTGLHFLSLYIRKESLDIASKMIEVGGKELIMIQDREGKSVLHKSCNILVQSHSIAFITMLLHIGGRDIVMLQDHSGKTALHRLCTSNHIQVECENQQAIRLEAIQKLGEIGGPELLMSTTGEYDFTALHLLFRSPTVPSLHIISHLINIGRWELIVLKDAFDKTIFDYMSSQWELFGQCFETIINALPQSPSILHTAISNKLPSAVIREIINYSDEFILSRDAMNKYPIEVAALNDLRWNEGMDYIITSMALAQEARPVIYVAAEYGLKWQNYMQEISLSHLNEVRHGFDIMTGLQPLQLAASGELNDLDTLYELMSLNPAVVHI
jgi:ankyrin repeat protein